MSRPEGYKSIKEFIAICGNCGHNHTAITGDNDLRESYQYVGYEVLGSCCYCSCEHYKQAKKNAQQIINESEGLTTEEKTPLYLSKLAKGELKTK